MSLKAQLPFITNRRGTSTPRSECPSGVRILKALQEIIADPPVVSSLHSQYVSFYTTRLLSAAIGQATQQLTARTLGTAAAAAGGFDFTGLCPNNGATVPAVGAATTTSAIPINSPFWYSTYNLHPFDQFAATACTTAGAIYLIIFTFFSE
jgi:hypothetical protein